MKNVIAFIAFVIFAYALFILSAADRDATHISGGYKIDPAKGYYDPGSRFKYTFEDFQ